MYKIIGADGQQYGPVSADQLRDWIKHGRANAHTRVLAEGSTEWKTLAELPEFAAALSPGAAPSGAAPTAGRPLAPTGSTAEAEAIAQAILARDYNLQIGRCISRGFDLVKSRFWLSVGATFLILLVSSAASVIPFASLVLGMVFWSGLDWMFLKLVRGEKAELSDAFAGFGPAFVPLMLFSLVGQLLTALGFVLCILPGIYLTVAWTMLAGLLIMDKGLEFWPAMELSRKVITRHWWVMFGLLLVCLLLMLLGTLICVVGVFVTMPIAVAAIVYAYEDIFGSQPKPAAAVPSQPLVPMAPKEPETPVTPAPAQTPSSPAPETPANPPTDPATPGQT